VPIRTVPAGLRCAAQGSRFPVGGNRFSTGDRDSVLGGGTGTAATYLPFKPHRASLIHPHRIKSLEACQAIADCASWPPKLGAARSLLAGSASGARWKPPGNGFWWERRSNNVCMEMLSLGIRRRPGGIAWKGVG
jgi:hypothetical protein